MKHLSAQLAIALQRSQLYEVVARQAQREALLNQILDAIRQSLDLHQILCQAASEVRRAFKASCSMIQLFDPEEDVEHDGVTATADGVTNTAVNLKPLLRDTPVLECTHTRSPLLIESVSQHPLTQATAEDHAAEALLATTICLEGKTKGIFCVQQWDTPRHWTEDESLLLQEVADQLAIAVQQAQLYQRLHEANTALEQIANLDGLTGVANRRRFDTYMQRIWRWLRRDGQSLCLILADVDFFKQYNDYYGHLEGDECLKKVAQAIAQVVHRPHDLVCRYGGEEFVIALPQTTQEGALHIAEQIQAAIAALAIEHVKSAVSKQITLSFGIACCIPSADRVPQTLIAAADTALYQAKAQGRDRIATAWQ